MIINPHQTPVLLMYRECNNLPLLDNACWCIAIQSGVLEHSHKLCQRNSYISRPFQSCMACNASKLHSTGCLTQGQGCFRCSGPAPIQLDSFGRCCNFCLVYLSCKDNSKHVRISSVTVISVGMISVKSILIATA